MLDKFLMLCLLWWKFTCMSSKGVSMAVQDYNVDVTKSTADPRTTLCDCKTSMVLPPHPRVHCPKCHASYTARGLQRPAYCAHCKFSLRNWRLRNNVPALNVPFL